MPSLLRSSALAVLAAAVLPAALAQETVVGSWTTVTKNCGVVPVHALYSPGDKIFFTERLHLLGTLNDGFSAAELTARAATGFYNQNPNAVKEKFLTDSAEFDLNTNQFKLTENLMPLAEPIGKNQGYAFCSGHAQMADGRYLSVGGDAFWGVPFNGANRTSDGRRDIRVMTPSAGAAPATFVKVADINNVDNLGPDDPRRALWGRWYPSVLTLPNEDVMIIGGQRAFFVPDNVTWDNPTYEIYHPKTQVSDTPVRVKVLADNYPVNMYPVVYVLPKSGNLWTYANNASAILNVQTKTETPSVGLDLSKEDGLLGRSFPFAGTNFLPMLTLKDDYKMTSWFCGGVNGTAANGLPTPRAYNAPQWWANCPDCAPTARCNYLELETEGAAWMREEMPIARSQPTAVNLPDGTIGIFSGSGKGHQGGVYGLPVSTVDVKEVVIFNPFAPKNHPSRWVTAAAAPTGRHYHNIALLREDGTVVTGGGDAQNGVNPNTDDPADMTLDVYSPPYKFATNIPELAPLAVKDVTYGQLIVVPFTTDVAQNITRVGIIRYASVTHTVNLDQRHIELEIVKYAANKLLVRLPAKPEIATPGNWMVWPVDSRGVPVKKSALINIRASNPGGDAVWTEAETIPTPVFRDPFAPVVAEPPAPAASQAADAKNSASGAASGWSAAAAAAAGLAVAVAGGIA
ncbi:hypothetical protein DFJ77DRAFT_551106 [Powellomyces hirtus]|nr:hypothetical protein DFJ77DRAFT_551106 [Powellomyces hirtus]